MSVTGNTNWGVLRLAGPPLVLALLCLLAYLPFLGVPLFADSYIQIQLGRDFGPREKWDELFHDALQRCRFTSILLTHWTEQWFGIAPRVLRLSSLGLHWLNCLLLFSLGYWPRLGYRLSFAAACFFAIYQRPQEAVTWYAASSDLLVFFFLLLASICWIRFLHSQRWSLAWYALAFGLYILALLSKEAAVMFPLIAAGLTFIDSSRRQEHLRAVIPFAVLASIYLLAAWFARDGHVYLRDGSVSLLAPAASVIARTSARLFWLWGLLAASALLFLRPAYAMRILGAVLAWIVIASLPYAFLTGQDSLSSRHTYLAAAAIAFLVGAAFLELWDRRRQHTSEFALLAAVCLVYQVGTLWAYRHPEVLARSRPTTELLRVVSGYTGPIHVECFPGGPVVAEHVLAIGTDGHAWPAYKTPARPARHFDGCERKPAAQTGSGT